jgi:hypothetical protein
MTLLRSSEDAPKKPKHNGDYEDIFGCATRNVGKVTLFNPHALVS